MQIPTNNPCTSATATFKAGQILFLFHIQRILILSVCPSLSPSAAIVWLAFQILSKFVVQRGDRGAEAGNGRKWACGWGVSRRNIL